MDYWLGFIFMFLQIVTFSSTAQVDLTKKPTSDNKWFWTVSKLDSSPLGWYRDVRGAHFIRYYTTCNLVKQPNSWLRNDPLITIPSAVKKVYIVIDYKIINCSQFRDVTYCREYFDLYVHQSGKTTTPNPLTNNATYEKITKITAATLDISVTKTIGVDVKGKYLELAFHDQGSCSSLYSVTVSYYVCPELTLDKDLVSLPHTMAPANNSEPVLGNCVTNADHEQGSLNVNCQSNGAWNISSLKGRCVCKEDTENIGGECKGCPDGEYNDQKGLNCTVLPSAPRNVQASFVNQTALEIQWLPPEIIGDQTHVFYDVDCRKPCDKDDGNECVDKACGIDVIFLPYKDGLSMTHVMVSNLSSFVNYTIKVYARNRVSELAKRKYGIKGTFTAITVMTNGSVPGKPEVSVEQPETAVVVSWTLKEKNGVIKAYHVTYISEDDSSDTGTVTTKKMELQFDLKAGKTYEFQVFAVNNIGKGPAGVKSFTLRNDDTKKLQLIAIAAGGGGGLLLILLIVIIVVFVVSRRRRSVEKDYIRSIQQGSELQTTNPRDQRTYIDPGNYIDLQELLSSFTSELKRSDIKLEGIIGQGEFADVYKGTLKTRDGKEVVAVKVLRPGSSEKNQKDFLSEASIMGQFDHPNVIQLIGVVTRSRPMMILTEFLESGSLDHFLKARDGELTSLQLIGMARGVASGMTYLSELNFIHRDLAARNVLVGENMLCKVSDFGLSRELADDSEASAEYTTQGGKIPVRWTAPEALQHRTFSSASDVWSFGILMWEIMSYCDRPYWDWNNFDVIKRVETGYRLPSPQGCPQVIHSLMMECWYQDKTNRPKFSDIVNRLDELIRSPEFLQDVSSSLPEASTEDDVPEFQSVDDWLKYINMERYSGNFQTASIDDMNKVTQLNENELRKMGITLIGHRNKMKKSIKAMKSQHHNKGMENDY